MEHGNDLKHVWPMGEAVSKFLSWLGKWVVRDSNIPKKDNEELIQGPGVTWPKDKLEVAALKPLVLCGLHKGIARFNSVAQW